MLLADSFVRKTVVMGFAVLGFMLLRQATIFDSRYAAREAMRREASALPAPGVRLQFTATAYCKGTTTASGVSPRSGVAASDPELLPVGSVIQLVSPLPRYSGIYTIMDTGPKVQGRHIDLYIWSCYEALDFGRQLVHITVLRLGWNPSASSPSLIETLFRRRERARQPLPSRPLSTPLVPPK